MLSEPVRGLDTDSMQDHLEFQRVILHLSECMDVCNCSFCVRVLEGVK